MRAVSRYSRRGLAVVLGSLLLPAASLFSQTPVGQLAAAADSDHDGLSDALEEQLLQQFAPTFMISANDCSVRPARFQPGLATPKVKAEDGTIYGQASPFRAAGGAASAVELHFYHLWRQDCGGHGHPLDTEHVAVLVQPVGGSGTVPTWKATYWYAAAHENTVCDVSQITRAVTLHAESHGATVWISPGKHASFLDASLCGRGCGADRCEQMIALAASTPVNLGEPAAPMNASTFASSQAWPLQAKMAQTNFPAAPLARLEALPPTQIAWFNPGRHPAQGIIAHSSSTEQALATSGRETTDALAGAGASTQGALATAGDTTGAGLATAGSSTGNALQTSYGHTRDALGTSVRHVGRALGLGHASGKAAQAR